MMKFLKDLARGAVFRLWQRTNSDWLLVLTYHRISDYFNPRVHHPGGWLSKNQFEQHIQYIVKNFSVIDLYEGLNKLETGTLKGGNIALTVDDGDASIETTVIPLLTKYDCPATFFINTAPLLEGRLHYPLLIRYLSNAELDKKKNIFPREFSGVVSELRLTNDSKKYNHMRRLIETYNNFIDPDEVRSLFVSLETLKGLDTGLFRVGLHGHEHQRFSMMTREWQSWSIECNIKILSVLDSYVPLFALPFGMSFDWNKNTLELIHQFGLTMLTCTGGVNRHKSCIYTRDLSDNQSVKNLVFNPGTGINI